MTAELEVWDLRKKEKIFSKPYFGSGNFSITFSPKNRLLEIESNEEKQLKLISQTLVKAMLFDLIGVL